MKNTLEVLELCSLAESLMLSYIEAKDEANRCRGRAVDASKNPSVYAMRAQIKKVRGGIARDRTFKAVKCLISSVWTLEYRQTEPGKVEIVRYSRDDDEGYQRKHELPSVRLVEDDHRTVLRAIIGGVDHEVTNPQYIFDYQA